MVMKNYLLVAVGVVLLAMLSAMVFAEQSNNVPAVQQQTGQSEPQVDQAATSSQTDSGKTGLSKRNQAIIDVAEQKKLRQQEIEKERSAVPQPQ